MIKRIYSSKSSSVVLATVLACGIAGASQAAPAEKAKHTAAGMIDARVNMPESYRMASGARPGAAVAGFAEARRHASTIGTAIRDLSRMLPGLDVRLSGLTGGPESVQNKQGTLTDAAPGQSSEAAVRAFLGEHGAIYGLAPEDLADIVVLGDSAGGSSGLRMLRVEQQIDGRPIFQSETRFLLDREGRLVKSVGRMVPAARAFAPPTSSGGLTAAEAVVRLLAAEGRTAQAERVHLRGAS